MSNVPIPDTSDSDGDHDPIKLMDYYTEVVNTRVNTVSVVAAADHGFMHPLLSLPGIKSHVS